MKVLCKTIILIYLLTVLFYSHALADLNNGLVAYYPFNKNADDQSGNGYNGIVNGAILSADRFGIAESAYSFDGKDDYIVINNFSLSYSSLSISVWVLFESHLNSLWSPEIIGTPNENLAFQLEISPSNYILWDWATEDQRLRTDSEIFELGSWHHIAAVYDANKSRIYYDSTLVEETNATGSINLVDAKIIIGKDVVGNSCFWNGLIDEIRIYNRALTESEILELYDSKQNSISGTIFTVSEILGYTASVGGATVKSIETGITAVSDIYGSFELQNMSIGNHTLEIFSSFFKPVTTNVNVINGNNSIKPIMLSDPICSHLYTQDDINQAIEVVNTEKNKIIAEKDLTISQLTESMSQMYTKDYVDNAIKEAEKRGELKYDINNDGKVGLEEIIRYLEQLSGVRLESLIVFPDDKKYFLSK